jgi:2-dehydro-3-deoxyglucarate aldolase/4-hydroxy-2-oxoheptanedioate aldolase
MTEGITTMKHNQVKETLRGGGVAMGVMCLEFATSGIGRISAEAGAEFVVFDMEHTGWSLETIKMVVASSRSTDLVPIVRVPVNDYHFIAHTLDVGAMGLLFPLVGSAEQAKFAVQCAMYPPRGRRGCAFSVSHDDYQGGDLNDKIVHSNDNLLLIAQIETAEGLQDVDAIAAVDGIDALLIGPFDLTASLGIPGRFDHPKFLDGVGRVLGACQSHGKAAALAAMDPAELASGPADGFRLLLYLADLWIYQQALSRCFRQIRERWPKR